MTDSLRDTLAAAFDASSGDDTPAPDTSSAVDTGASDVPDATPTETAAAPETGETAAQAAQRARDEAGRFAKQQKAKTPAPPAKGMKALQAAAAATPAAPAVPVTPEAQAAAVAQPVTPTAPATRAPQAWTPAAREHWAKLPAEVQAEVDRRERETARALQEAAPARRTHEAFQATIAPYRALLTGEPMQVVSSLLQTAAQLQTAPPHHKAALVAKLVQDYGIPIDALAQALDGAPAGQGAQAQQQGGAGFDPATIAHQVRQQVMQDMQRAQQQRMQQKAVADIESFKASAEFLDDVREDVAALMEAASRRGVELNLQDAYNRACWADERIRSVLQQRQQASQANAHRASTQASLAAASSVKTQPASAAPPADTSLRGRLAAEWDKAQKR